MKIIELTGDQIADKAEEFINTSFHQSQRLKGDKNKIGPNNGGIDCVGVVILTLEELGQKIEDEVRYGYNDHFDLLKGKVLDYFRKPKKINESIREEKKLLKENGLRDFEFYSRRHFTNGDLILFRTREMYNHCGIYTEGNFIHAHDKPINRVLKEKINLSWFMCIEGVYRFKGLVKE